MEQENGNENKIINMSFLSKYFFIGKKFQLAHQRDIASVDLGNLTQASRVIRGSMKLAFDV